MQIAIILMLFILFPVSNKAEMDTKWYLYIALKYENQLLQIEFHQLDDSEWPQWGNFIDFFQNFADDFTLWDKYNQYK